MSPAPIEFWFEFSSPYAYFAALEVDALAARCGRSVVWRPFLLGVLFRKTGMAPLTQQPLRGQYARRDWARLARRRGAPFQLPAGFPVRTLAPARAIYAIDATAGSQAAGDLAIAFFKALYGDGKDISDPQVAADIGERCGVARADLLEAMEAAVWSDVLRARTAEAERRGIFGSPWVFADGEPFWGADRLPMVEEWLRRGGW